MGPPSTTTTKTTMRDLEEQADSTGFDDIYLVPILGGGLLLLILIYWTVRHCKRSRSSRKSSDHPFEFDTPPIIEGHHAATSDTGPAVMSPMDPAASFSSFKDTEPTKTVWLSGSGRTLNSAKSGGSSRSMRATSLADFVLDTTQKDQIFSILHHDAALATQRLAVDKIAFERVLGEHATRQTWLCQFEGDEIVVKRLAPPTDVTEVFPALLNFVHEIQLAASLEHPNIARFLGLAWGKNLRSLCYVAEYLPRGDLASFLRRSRKRRLHTSSSTISNSSSSNAASAELSGPSCPPSLHSSGSGFTLISWVDDKVPLAIAVARAIVYLHCRRPYPVAYRVVRTRKVALSDRYEAKLTDLTPAVGGSPPPDQEALAAGIGDVFWTAPELLTGGSPTLASDIYAFGVLMAELDSEAKRPYHNARDSRSGEKLRAFQVLNLVASDQLRPHFAASCPAEIRDLALACLRHNPMQRPTAGEVLQSLESCCLL